MIAKLVVCRGSPGVCYESSQRNSELPPAAALVGPGEVFIWQIFCAMFTGINNCIVDMVMILTALVKIYTHLSDL